MRAFPGFSIQRGKQCRSLWLGDICLTANYCPSWPRGRFSFHENGGRRRGECLDVNLTLWRVIFSITIYNLNWIARLLQFIPSGRRTGFSIGRFDSSEG